MLTDLDWLDTGKPFPPECAKNRLLRYKEHRELFEDKHENVYREQFRRIERVIGNFSEIISYATIVNYQKLISLKTADLAFGRKPNITVADDSKQKLIDSIVLDTQLFDKLYMSALDVSRYGDTVIMITSDGNIDVVAPALWFPVVDKFNMRKFRYHVFGFTYVIDTHSKTYGLKVQIHIPENPSECEERNYELQGNFTSGFKIQRDITDQSKMKLQTHLDTCPVYRISNVITSDRLFGIDDYRSVDSLVSELMVRISQISKVLDKFAQPSMTGPHSAMEIDDLTGQWVLKIGDYFPRNSESDPKPEYLTWDAGMDANFRQIELIINQLYTISEMGSALLGDLSNKTGDVPSGSALRRLMMSPLAKARRITNRYDVPVKKMLSVLAKMRGADIAPNEITITWNDGLPGDPAEDAEIASIRTGGKPTLSQYTAIQRLDNMSQSDTGTELEMIRADNIESSAGTMPSVETESVLEEI